MLEYRVVNAKNIWEFCEKVLFSSEYRGYSKLYAGNAEIKQIDVASFRRRGDSRLYRIEISNLLGENVSDRVLHEYFEDVIFPIARNNNYYFSPFYVEYYKDIDEPGYIYFARKPDKEDVELHIFGVKISLEKYIDKDGIEKDSYFINFVIYDEGSSDVISGILSTIGVPTKPYKIVF